KTSGDHFYTTSATEKDSAVVGGSPPSFALKEFRPLNYNYYSCPSTYPNNAGYFKIDATANNLTYPSGVDYAGNKMNSGWFQLCNKLKLGFDPYLTVSYNDYTGYYDGSAKQGFLWGGAFKPDSVAQGGGITGAAYNPLTPTVFTTIESGWMNLLAPQLLISNLSYGQTSFSYNAGQAITSITPSYDGLKAKLFTISPAFSNGLVFNTSTGVISGTPILSKATDYTITATNQFGSGSVVVKISVKPRFLMGFMSVELNEIAYAVDLLGKGVRHSFWFLNNQFQEIEAVGTITPLMNENFELIAQIIPGPPSLLITDYTEIKNKLRDLVKSKKEIFKYWQIGNEPDLIYKNINSSYTASRYVDFFLAASEVIREECSFCKIILAGISNQYDSSQNNFQYYKDIIVDIKKRSKYAKPFDVFDIHLYTVNNSLEDYKRVESAVNDYKLLISSSGYIYPIEFVSTEFGTHSAQPKNSQTVQFQTEKFQAETLIKLYTAFFNAGITKAFWVDVINNYKFGFQGTADGYFDLTGLIYNGKGAYDLANGKLEGTKKESYYAYKTLVAKILDKTAVIKIGNNIYKFSNANNAIYIAWSDGVETSLPLSITGTVKVSDYLGNESIKAAPEVIIGNSPVFIEVQ
ncbi:MAG: putative Ig domain-containing protein, partial [Candidatus Brennerbacteria bacterium]|nr:putative Ig domain-containing protein [Candidatus Brennerbacteria bacterium]